ncbi:MAG: hypothetical protein NVSMB3_07900 [Acidobacteriaceae bacterium]
MHPDLEKLIVLQRLDLELNRLREEITALPRRLAGLAARSSAAQASLLGFEESLAKEEKLRRSLESDTKDQSQRAARLRRQMDVVTTTAQADALEHEIAHASSEIERLENTELESMERTELLERQRAVASEELRSAEETLERERLRAADVISKGQLRMRQLEAERAEVRPAITDVALATYDRVAKAKGTGIAEGVDHKCSACQMMVRPQRWNELLDRSNDQSMMTCESCGRLLYWDAARDAPIKKNVQSVGGAESGGKAEVR